MSNCKMPAWCWIIIIIISIIATISLAYGIKYAINASYEKDEETKKDVKFEDKKEESDTIYDFHFENHKTNLNHKFKIEESKMAHELYKTGIIAPCVVVISVILAGMIYCTVIKPKMIKKATKVFSATQNNSTDDDRKVDSKESPNTIQIPKTRVEDFNNLIMMGYNKNQTAAAIQSSNSIATALDILNGTCQRLGYQNGDLLANEQTPIEQKDKNENPENGMVTIWI